MTQRSGGSPEEHSDRVTDYRGLSSEQASVLAILAERLPLPGVNWALTGSAGHVLQDVPLEVHDIDVQTDERSASKATDALNEFQETSLAWRESDRIRSLFATFQIGGVEVELMGALSKRGRAANGELLSILHCTGS